ncbi:MAG: thioredoxin family protein [Methanomassiliicoccales archaeon]
MRSAIEVQKNVREAVARAGIEAEIIKVEDVEKMTERGVMMTPALFIDGQPKAMGRIPSVEEIVSMLKDAGRKG